jgi:hypothetical protein
MPGAQLKKARFPRGIRPFASDQSSFSGTGRGGLPW